MMYPARTFAFVVVAGYAVALLVSYTFVRWILPENLKRPLGSEGRYVAIDGIRGYLAFGVYLHHCLATWIFLPEQQWLPLPRNFENQMGATSVAIFFMITAFLFWGRVQASRDLDWRNFFVTRLFRIFPLYLFVLVLICAVVAYESHWAATESVSAISKEVSKWLLFRSPDINHSYRTTLIVKGVTWTLLYEAWFYLSLPLLALVFLRKRAIWLKLLALGIVVFLALVNHIDGWIAATFLGGVFAVYWRMDEKRIKLAQTKWAAFVALACLCAVVLLLYKPFNVAGIALLSVFFAVIASGNTMFGLLKMRSALWLGEISYSIYLCHGLILWAVMQKIVPRMSGYDHSTKWFVASAIGIAPVVVLLCSASYLLVEKPLIGIGRRLSKRKSAEVVVGYDRGPSNAFQVG